MSPAQTEYQANSTSATSPNVNAKLNFSIENKGHSSSNKTQYKVVLPEGATFVTAENATGSFNEDTRELTLSINPIDPVQQETFLILYHYLLQYQLKRF